ncbi:MAG: carbohydrate-binding protein, partial [Caldilineae bacterium]
MLECDQWEALPGYNDRAHQRLIVELDSLSPAPEGTLSRQGFREEGNGDGAHPIYLPLVGGGSGGGTDNGGAPDSDERPPAPDGVIFVLASSANGSQGDYSFTPLANVSDYQVSLATGAATTGYPIPAPPPKAGPAPAIGLAYNSGQVDGMHTHRNNQPGSVGIGWSLEMGAITRHLKTCGVSQAPGDLCVTGDNYSIVLNGISSRLVKESGNLYRLQDDPHWQVEKLTSSNGNHPDAQREYWQVTTPDGVKYRFGGEFVDENGADQNSVFYVTVYDTDPAVCGNYAYDLCNKAWRWNLDRIEDPNGNVVNYFYDQETNYYKARNDSRSQFRKEYVRAGHVRRIEYTNRSGSAPAPHARVLFNMELRCTNPTTSTGCDWPSDFPDTPGDLACEASGACSQNRPTFWSQRRLDSVQTQVYDTGLNEWRTVALYDLTQSFPSPPTDSQGDTSEKKLWLDGVAQRPGGDFKHTAFAQTEAEEYDAQYGIGTENTTDVGRGRNVGWTNEGDYLFFRRVDFGSGGAIPNTVVARVASIVSNGRIEYRLDSTGGPLVATVNVPNTGGWQNWTTVSAPVSGASGVHDLYLVFRNGNLNVNWFRFTTSGTLPGLPAAQYSPTMLANRRNFDAAGVSPMYMPRVSQITMELGGATTFTYGKSHECPSNPSSLIRLPYDCFPAWDPDDPNNPYDDGWVLWNKWKVTQLQKSDTFSGNETESYTYSYSTPTWHYSDDPALPDINSCSNCPTRHWNDFRGSEVVTVTDASGAKTEHRFFRGMNGDRLAIWGGSYTASITLSDNSTRTDENWWRGKEVESRRLNSSNNARLRTVNWFKQDLTAGSGSGGAHFTGRERVDRTWYGTYTKTTRTDTVYDGYGNVIQEVSYGDVNAGGDERTLQRSFLYNLSAYIVDRPQWEKLWAGTTPGSSGQEKAKAEYAYDGAGIGTSPSKGNLTLVRRYDSATGFHDTTTTYDSYGRPTTVTDANGHSTTTAYDGSYGYVAAVTNALGHVTNYLHDPGWGVVTKVTDPNGKVTELVYDVYGRLVNVWLPTEARGVDPASQVYEYHPEARPAYVRSRQLQAKSGSLYLDGWTYFDGFGRTIQSQQPAAASGQRIVTSRHYNNLGRLMYESAPYQLSGGAGSGYAAPNWSTVNNYHYLHYEELGNVWLDETKSGSSVLWSDVTIFDAWWRRHYDPNGNRMDNYLDAYGRLVQVAEFNVGGAAYNTTYSYDVQGNLTGVTDHLGHTTSMSYDWMGRKIGMTDPDMGSWSYVYDGVGNLTGQRDGRNRWVYMSYDALNRLTTKRKDSVTGALIAEYSYDTVQKGQLSWSNAYNDAGGVVTLYYDAYDARGRLTSQRWVVPGTGGGTFRMDYTYNEADQRASLRYPGGNGGQQGELVTYTYNSIGQMTGVSGTSTYVSSASYNAAGQLTQLVQPGLTRQRVYESNTLRLSVLKAGTASPWTNRQHLTYSYDNAGNVTSLVDGQNSGQKQCFQYDYLHRLTAAFTGNSGCTAYSATGTGPYNHTYAYNAIGNITSYAGNGYTYGSKPHAVTGAFGNSYGYDGNGNQTTSTIGGVVYTLVYDYENRLTAVKQGSVTIAQFWYDADGNRVKGTVNGVTTVTIGGVYEYSGGAGKSYYTGPGGVVALRSGGTVYYLLTDHLNSTARIVNSAGVIQADTYYYPYGG